MSSGLAILEMRVGLEIERCARPYPRDLHSKRRQFTYVFGCGGVELGTECLFVFFFYFFSRGQNTGLTTLNLFVISPVFSLHGDM